MSPEIYPTIVMVTAILTAGGVLILRPISKRLGALLEVMTQQRLKAANADPAEMARVRELLSSIDGRLTMMEERQDFAEALLSAGDTKLLSIHDVHRAPERN